MDASCNSTQRYLHEDPLQFFEGNFKEVSDSEDGYYEEALRILQTKKCTRKGKEDTKNNNIPLLWVPQTDRDVWTTSSCSESTAEEEEEQCEETSDASEDNISVLSESDEKEEEEEIIHQVDETYEEDYSQEEREITKNIAHK
tara:strand:- start:1126 stop:1554 length:429 start_codon:yes stop_codon:yes gene_type:complete